ncbi:glycosyl transferase [Terriglobus roseus DSM 18391]|uniref:Glycosyl transferase n=1 Tax=Terriglobus roseus (strain DSM 18391 / NRRL B-41598 / KBS 63) TaxID=926566 RepID=I3ZEX4_TERRK|nr:glycosyltransferase [Terriglobus roseus]AFL87792.1 glycosyl transferase [Terriglobus roseus DSM 18391]
MDATLQAALPCTLVVPCYNEEQRFHDDAFAAFLAAEPEAHLLFVNDGSRDGTLARLHAFAALHGDRCSVLDVQPNGGKGEAVRRGMLHALRTAANGTLVGFWDADLATPLDAYADFRLILETLPEIEMVFGSRIQLLGRHVKRNAMRHYAGRVFATTVSLALGLPIYDSQCGAKVFRVSGVLREVLAMPFVSRWIFDVEVLARFLAVWRAGGAHPETRIYELPLKVWIDVPGSKVHLSDFFRSFTDLIKIRSSFPAGRGPRGR